MPRPPAEMVPELTMLPANVEIVAVRTLLLAVALLATLTLADAATAMPSAEAVIRPELLTLPENFEIEAESVLFEAALPIVTTSLAIAPTRMPLPAVAEIVPELLMPPPNVVWLADTVACWASVRTTMPPARIPLFTP